MERSRVTQSVNVIIDPEILISDYNDNFFITDDNGKRKQFLLALSKCGKLNIIMNLMHEQYLLLHEKFKNEKNGHSKFLYSWTSVLRDTMKTNFSEDSNEETLENESLLTLQWLGFKFLDEMEKRNIKSQGLKTKA